MSFDVSRTAVAMCSAGLAVLVIGIWAARHAITEARGLDKIVALRHVCVAVPLAMFGALHLFGGSFVTALVPSYMPSRTFWVYAVGSALIAASVSIATTIGVRWSGALFGVMMFLFVAMIHLPGAVRQHDRILWVIVFRELSFGGAGWLLAATGPNGWRGPGQHALITVGRVSITMAVLVFGIEHFLYPTGLPGVPLRKQLPTWIPGRELIDYVMGAALLATGGSVLVRKDVRTVAACAGGWLLLMVLVIYGPVLVTALSDPRTPVQMEGINYFADTLLFTGVILALASSAQPDAR